jgi:hypothetical protein
MAVTTTATVPGAATGDITFTGTSLFSGTIDVAGTTAIVQSAAAIGSASIIVEQGGIIRTLGDVGFNQGFSAQGHGGTVDDYGNNVTINNLSGVGNGLASDPTAAIDFTSSAGTSPSGNVALTGQISCSLPIHVSNTVLTFNGTTNGAGPGVFIDVGGTLNGSGSIGRPVQVGEGGVLSGNLTITNTVSGGGLVAPSDAPEVLTVQNVDSSGGLNYAFAIGQSDPDFMHGKNSVNDVLRLTDPSTPFLNSLTSANTVSLYFDTANSPLQLVGQSFRGGFYTDMDADFLSLVDSANYQYYVEDDADGTILFGGRMYDPLPLADVIVTTVSEPANFNGLGTVNGYVTQFSVVSVTSVPEPSSVILLCGIAGLMLRRRRDAG